MRSAVLFFLLSMCFATVLAGQDAKSHQQKVIRLLQEGHNDSAYQLNQNYLHAALRSGLRGEQAVALKLTGIYHYFQAKPDSALPYYHQSLQLFEKLNDTLEAANVLNNIALIHQSKNDHKSAIRYHLKSVQSRELLGDTLGLLVSYGNLSSLYKLLGDKPKEKMYLTKAMFLAGHLKTAEATRLVLSSKLGSYYHSMNSLDSAIFWFSQAEMLAKSTNNERELAMAWYNQANVLVKLERTEEARSLYQKAVVLFNKTNYQEGRASALLGAGNLYYVNAAYTEARNNYLEAERAADDLGNVALKLTVLENLYNTYDKLGHTELAFQYFRAFVTLRDSIQRTDKRLEMAEIEKQFELENLQKQGQIAALKAEAATAKARRQQLFAVVIAVFLLLIVLVLILYLTNQKNKQKAMLDQNARQLAELQLSLLRAQLNPHFIFNALNGIQGYILEHKPLDASRFLSRFARLMRATLDASAIQFHSLPAELAIIEDYLLLEQLRFGQKFNYQIQTDPTMNRADYQLPVMLLQPILENAILHGLSNRPENGLLTVDFSLNADHFIVTITDNGIGLQASNAAKSPGDQHISKGSSLIAERLALLSKKGIHCTLNYDVPFPEHTDFPGTRVVLALGILS